MPSASSYLFDVAYTPDGASVGAAVVVVIGLTLFIGMLNSRGIYDGSPLEVLRAET